MTGFRAALVVAYALLVGGVGCSDSPNATRVSARNDSRRATSVEPITFDDSSPESALRAFLLAMMARDSEQLDKLVLPHPDDSVLITGAPSSPEQVAKMSQGLAGMPLQRLRLGETVRRADGSAEVLDLEHVNAHRAVILTPFDPEPFVLVETDGRWKVDASPLVEKLSK